MRHQYEAILGEEIRYLAIETRERKGLTQREMSEKLHMSESSHSDLETGETLCCGALSEFLLLQMQPNPSDFIERVEKRFAEYYEKEMQTV